MAALEAQQQQLTSDGLSVVLGCGVQLTNGGACLVDLLLEILQCKAKGLEASVDGFLLVAHQLDWTSAVGGLTTRLASATSRPLRG